jgi:hypothetical protein
VAQPDREDGDQDLVRARLVEPEFFDRERLGLFPGHRGGNAHVGLLRSLPPSASTASSC